MASYRRAPKVVQPYRANCDEEDIDDDDVDLDDDNADGYDGLTDYEEDLDYPESSEKRESYQRPQRSLCGAESSIYNSHNSGIIQHRSISESCPRVLEHVDDNRKDHHNHLERKRRASIKGSYNDLREAIPALRGSKASRAVTLQRAVEYIEELTKRNAEHTQCVDTLTRQNEHLDRQILDLSRNYQRLEENEYSTLSLLERGLITTLSPATYNQSVNVTGTDSKYFTSTCSDTNTHEFSPLLAPANFASNDTFHLLRAIPQSTTTSSSVQLPADPLVCTTQFNINFPNSQSVQPSSTTSHYVVQPISLGSVSSTRYVNTSLPQASVLHDSRHFITSSSASSIPVSVPARETCSNDYSASPTNPIKSIKYILPISINARSNMDNQYTTLSNVVLPSVEHHLTTSKSDPVNHEFSVAVTSSISSFSQIKTIPEIPVTTTVFDTHLVSSTLKSEEILSKISVRVKSSP